jgi:hypothetical protein
VHVWRLGKHGALVAWGGNGGTDLALTTDYMPTEEELPGWLIPDSLADWDLLLCRAEVLGLEAIEEAGADAGTCRILMEHDYYGPRCGYGWVLNDEHSAAWEGTRAEAEGLVEEFDDSTYCTEHNECGRPSLKIVAVE